MEIKRLFLAGVTVAQNGRRLPRIVIAVVKKEDDLTADLALETAGGDDLRPEKTFRKKAARLLPETNDRRAHGV